MIMHNGKTLLLLYYRKNYLYSEYGSTFSFYGGCISGESARQCLVPFNCSKPLQQEKTYLTQFGVLLWFVCRLQKVAGFGRDCLLM